MTDDERTNHEGRRTRLATRRRRIRVLGAAIVVVLAAGAIGTAATLRSNDNSSATPAATKTTTIGADPRITVGLGRAARLRPPRRISHADPMKLWVGGDSLAGSFGPALGQIAGATGVVDTTIDYKVSSGLADNGIRDWYDHAQQQMSSANPDAVVFIIGTNDVSIVNSQDSNNDGVPDWEVAYRKKVDDMLTTFVGGSRHRTVFFLGPPTLGQDNLATGAEKLDKVIRSEATKFAPDVVYVSAYQLFSDRLGQYSASLPDATGNIVQMRISDGVHFTVDGAMYLAKVIWKLIDKRWKVASQADPSQPISYTIAPGSGDYVPGVGYYRPHVHHSSSTTEHTSTTVPTSTVTTKRGTGPTTSKPPGSTVPPTTTKTTTVTLPPTTVPKVPPRKKP